MLNWGNLLILEKSRKAQGIINLLHSHSHNVDFGIYSIHVTCSESVLYFAKQFNILLSDFFVLRKCVINIKTERSKYWYCFTNTKKVLQYIFFKFVSVLVLPILFKSIVNNPVKYQHNFFTFNILYKKFSLPMGPKRKGPLNEIKWNEIKRNQIYTHASVKACATPDQLFPKPHSTIYRRQRVFLVAAARICNNV